MIGVQTGRWWGVSGVIGPTSHASRNGVSDFYDKSAPRKYRTIQKRNIAYATVIPGDQTQIIPSGPV